MSERIELLQLQLLHASEEMLAVACYESARTNEPNPKRYPPWTEATIDQRDMWRAAARELLRERGS